jgi:predicted permease
MKMPLANWLYTIPFHLRSLFRHHRKQADLDEELRDHIERQTEENRTHGMGEEEARWAALRAFGNLSAVREQTHDTWASATMERLERDIRYAARQCRRNKRFASICILTLALGIAAEAILFSVIHGVIIDPYPYRDAMRMVHLHLYDKEPIPDDLALDETQFKVFARSPVLDGAVAVDDYLLSLTGSGLPEPLQVSRMSLSSFEFLGVRPLLGRAFSSADSTNVAVLSESFWKSHFAGRADAVNKNIELDHEAYQVIGVMPARFAWRGADVYVPLAQTADPRRPAGVYARIRAGVINAQAEQVLDPMLQAFAKETPFNFPHEFKLHVVPINEVAIGKFRGFLMVLFLSVSFLLALACLNVAILLLARGEARSAEVSMRKALGASHASIVRQLLTETMFLALAGGCLGTLLTMGGIHLVRLLVEPLPDLFPAESSVRLNVPVLLFSVGISMLTGLLCGMWPALRLSGASLRSPVDGGSHKLAGRHGARKAHSVLLTLQVAIAVTLLAGSGATLRKLNQLLHAPLGYEPEHLAGTLLELREGAHVPWADRVHYFEQIREAAARDPEIESAAIGPLPPQQYSTMPLTVTGQSSRGDHVVAGQVSREYFATLQIPLLQGRVWSAAETTEAAHVALINDAMRRRYWLQQSPIGQGFVLNDGITDHNIWQAIAPGNNQHYQVIGVVGDTPNHGLGEATYPALYIPYSMEPSDGINLVVRSRRAPGDVSQRLKQDVFRIDAGQAVGRFTTASELLEKDSLGRERFAAWLFVCFAALGLAFAVSGLYSTQAYLVAQRTRELGVRMALGARRRQIVETVMRGCLVSVLAGTVTGLAASLGFSRVFAYWTGGNVSDPMMLAVVTGILVGAVLAASAAPAWTAASIDPIEALRSE